MKQALINGAKSDKWYTPIKVITTMLMSKLKVSR